MRKLSFFWSFCLSIYQTCKMKYSLMGKKPRRGTFSLTFQHSNLYRMVALGNIVLQLLFPLMMAFTPTIVAARQSVLSENKATAQTSSQTNTLPDLGSSTGDISRKGSETDTLNQQREQQQTLDKSAAAAQRLWGILGGPSKRDQGLDVATGMASGMANQAAQEWLNQFGNASLSFSTQGTGSADILLPLLDTPNTLLFTQPGLRRSDDRTTGNIGLGARTFTQDWMFGVNTFYDNDFTGDNRRLGVGVEAWRDYLKLSANSYFRLSDWHQSPLSSMKDYDERPANGYDVRAEAYLPGYPQLGGKLMYEHYQGKNVALDGGTSDLRDNPSAVTVGLSYTPVPLIKLGLDHTAGSGINNTNVSLGFSYRLGVPFANQLSPESVDFSRTLAGSRYDLVDRNYDIVLQYRKQDLISLLLSTSDTPYSGGSVTVTANVTTKHGLDHIVWDAPSLIAAGGTLTSLTDRSAKVNLPIVSAMAARQASPSYVVGAVAYDKNGNASNHVTLTLTPARAPQDIGSLVVTQDKSVANGVAQNTLTLTTIDTSTSQALANAVVDLAFTYTSGPNEGQSLPNQEVTTDSSGKATIGVTSILVGSVLVTATLKSNGNHTSATMSFVEDNSTATLLASNVTVNVNNAVANGLAKNSVKVVVTDSSGSPVPNAVVNFTADNGATIMATGTTGADGSLIQTLTSSKAGSSLVTATINGTTRSVSVMFIADDSSAGLDGTTNPGSSLTATSGAIANNVATNTVTATVTDHNGNPVSGLAVDFSVDSGASVVTATGTTNGSGIATTTVTASVAGAHTVTATANGSSATVSTTFVADVGNADQAASSIIVDKANYAVGSDMVVTVMLKDASNNVVTGALSQLTDTSVTVANATLKSAWTDNNDGTYTATYKTVTDGLNNKAGLKLSGWGSAVESAPYAIRTLKGVTANAYTFNISDNFPKTGFANAVFTVNATGNASDYTWSSSNDTAVSVDSTGKVMLNNATSSPVTITATMEGGDVLTYTFTLTTWYTNNKLQTLDFSAADLYCKASSASLPTRSQLTSGVGVRGVGTSLIGEWGRISSYANAYFNGDKYWTSDAYGTSGDEYYLVDGSGNTNYYSFDTVQHYVACRKSL